MSFTILNPLHPSAPTTLPRYPTNRLALSESAPMLPNAKVQLPAPENLRPFHNDGSRRSTATTCSAGNLVLSTGDRHRAKRFVFRPSQPASAIDPSHFTHRNRRPIAERPSSVAGAGVPPATSPRHGSPVNCNDLFGLIPRSLPRRLSPGEVVGLSLFSTRFAHRHRRLYPIPDQPTCTFRIRGHVAERQNSAAGTRRLRPMSQRLRPPVTCNALFGFCEPAEYAPRLAVSDDIQVVAPQPQTDFRPRRYRLWWGAVEAASHFCDYCGSFNPAKLKHDHLADLNITASQFPVYRRGAAACACHTINGHQRLHVRCPPPPNAKVQGPARRRLRPANRDRGRRSPATLCSALNDWPDDRPAGAGINLHQSIIRLTTSQ